MPVDVITFKCASETWARLAHSAEDPPNAAEDTIAALTRPQAIRDRPLGN